MSEQSAVVSRRGSIESVLAQDKMLSDRAKRVSLGAESVMDDPDLVVCGCVWTKNARTLFVSLVLFATMAAAQTAGALIAHSMAMLADCTSMAVDAVTYAINLVAECKEEPDQQVVRRNQLIASGISFAALIGISVFFFYQGLQSILSKDWEGSDGGDSVNGWIVLGFAVVGVLFDVLSLVPHFVYGLPCIEGPDDVEDGKKPEARTAERMNLCSALMHVAADLMRSLTTLTESILILGYGINGDEADAYATVVVSGLILLGAVMPIIDWSRDINKYFKDFPKPSESNEPVN